MELKVARITPFNSEKSPTLRAFVSLEIYTPTCTFEVRDCKYHRNENGDWIQLPSRAYEDRETGEQRYTNTIHFPDKDEWVHFQNAGKHEIRKALDDGYVEDSGERERKRKGEEVRERVKESFKGAAEDLDERVEAFVDDIPF